MGAGRRLRHVEVEFFFLQGLIREGVKLAKEEGTEHIADLGTKHVPRDVLLARLKKGGFEFRKGALREPPSWRRAR